MRGLVINITLIILSVLLSFICYPLVNNDIAIHWAGAEANLYVSKNIGLFIMPLFMVITLLLSKLNLKNEVINHKITLCITILLLSIHFLIIFIGLGHNLNINVILGMLLGMTTVIFSIMTISIKQNGVFGLRTPWTIKSEYVWKKSNKFFGVLSLLTGFLIILLSLFIPDISITFAIILLLFVAFLGVLHSYITYKKLIN